MYVTIFRDGQDTIKRDFSFERQTIVEYGTIKFIFSLQIPKDTASVLKTTIEYTSDGVLNNRFNADFINKIDFIKKDSIQIVNDKDKPADEKKAHLWKTGTFEMNL